MTTTSLSPVADSPADIDFDRRFGGIARLYGAPALARFRAARVCVIGVGGVGSWIVEALARSAVGNITMIDLDNLSESNINRQIHALSDTLGMAKVSALAQRIGLINPYCRVTEVEEFITEENVAAMIGGDRFDHIIDAIDDVRAKVALAVYCRKHGMSLTTIGGAGGQTDPTRIEVRDLCRTEQEPLLARVRKRLRALHGFPRGTRNKFHIDAVFSTEPLAMPSAAFSPAPADDAIASEAAHAGETGPVLCLVDEFGAAAPAVTPAALAPAAAAVCAVAASGAPAVASPPAEAAAPAGFTGLNCAGYGSSVAVTASFGFVAAAHVLRKIAGQGGVEAPGP
jgi:tRNA A37 threonylcarbamoyladenosine dehydratase